MFFRIPLYVVLITHRYFSNKLSIIILQIRLLFVPGPTVKMLTFLLYYFQSLGILASIPAALLILSLVGFLLYLLTRCCDRKPQKSKSQSCQKCTLITTTLFCCAAIGFGKFNSYLIY